MRTLLVLLALTATAHARSGPSCAPGDAACRQVVDVLEELRVNLHGPCGTPRVNAPGRLVSIGPAAIPTLYAYFDDRSDELAQFARRAAADLGHVDILAAWCSTHPGRKPCGQLAELTAATAARQALLTTAGRWHAGQTTLELDGRGGGSLETGKKVRAVTGLSIFGAYVMLALDDGTEAAVVPEPRGGIRVVSPGRSRVLLPSP